MFSHGAGRRWCHIQYGSVFPVTHFAVTGLWLASVVCDVIRDFLRNGSEQWRFLFGDHFRIARRALVVVVVVPVATHALRTGDISRRFVSGRRR